MSGWPVLSALVFLPLIGAALTLFARGGTEEQTQRNARGAALTISLATALIALLALIGFDENAAGYQYEETRAWLGDGVAWRMGVDGISMPLIALTAVLTPICVLAGWNINKRAREFMAAFLVLEAFVIGAFAALDLVLFYIFFEGGLIPLFIVIGVWGGPNRFYAAYKFFLYTLLGSLLMLVAVAWIALDAGTTDIPTLTARGFAPEAQMWLWLAFFASFAVKLPMFPFHTWLPDAHVEAPTAGSVMLAAALLKLGAYGFLRFSLPMFPVASETFAPYVLTLSVIAVIYAALVALVQDDAKKLVAYASVSHMGLVTLGLFAATRESALGAAFQMLSHGWISAAMFLCVGVIYDRAHTRDVRAFGGLAQSMPLFAGALFIAVMGNLALPGLSGFVGEFLVIVGAYSVSALAASVAAVGAILTAGYSLLFYWRMALGEVRRAAFAEFPDLSKREMATLAPLLVVTVILGMAPGPLLRMMEPAVDRTLATYEAGLARAATGFANATELGAPR